MTKNEVLKQPEQEPVATIAVRWHEPVGKVAFVLEVNLPVGIHKVYTTPPEPVIDKSAAVRIATALGWEPKRKPLTDEQWQVMADMLGCLITRTQKDAIEAVIGIKE